MPKTIYRSMTPRQTDWMPPQGVECSLVAEISARRFRVTVHFDTSYGNQCRGSVAVLTEGKFETLLDLHTHDMPFIAEWHQKREAHKGSEIGAMLRRGTEFEDGLNRMLDELAQRGADIIGEAK